MSIVVLGISHHTAPIELLDEVSRAAAGTALLDELARSDAVSEAMVLGTCNRLEVVASVPQFHPAVESMVRALTRASGVRPDRLRPHLYLHHAERAAEHLFLTASGLDSMVVGESQIRYQIRTALGQARERGAVGPALSEVVEAALRVGKRVQTETQLDQAGRSLADEGLQALAEAGVPVHGATVVVLGAGSMAAVAAVAARRSGAGQVVVVNRDSERGERLARAVDGRTAGWADLADEIATADVVVACTGATGVLVDAPLVQGARTGVPRLLGILDLAMPHDVDPAVADLDGVVLAGMADLARRLEAGTGAGTAVSRARDIVTEEVADFLTLQSAQAVAPTVVALRRHADEVVAGELARLQSRLGSDLDPRVADEVAATVRRVVGKLLHTPTVRVKAAAHSSAAREYERALRHLFALDPGTAGAVSARDEEGAR